MIKKHFTSLALALSLSSPLLAYDKDLETLYPESTMLYGKVENIQKLAKLDPEHPIAKLFEHPAFKKHLLGMSDTEEKEELEKETLAFLKKHCLNRAAFGLLDIGIGKPDAETANSEDSQALALALDPKFFSAAMTIDCTATQAELDDLLKLAKEKTEELEAIVVEEFEGVPYSVLEHKKAEEGEEQEQDLYIALVDELLIVSLREEDIKDFIGKVKSPNKENTLASNPKYLDAALKLKKYDISMYARLDKMYDILIVDEETSLLKYIDDNPQMKMFISTKAIKDDLHLDAFDSAFWGAVVTEEGGDMKFGYSVKSKEGVAALFQHDKFIPEIPEYAFEGFKSMSVSSYDFKSNAEQLEKLVSKVSPLGFMTAKGQLGEEYKMIKTNFFDNLEPYHVQLSGHIDPKLADERGASQINVFKVKNADRIYELIEKLKEKMPNIKNHEFLGEKVYQRPHKNGLSYYAVVVNNFLVVTLTSEDDMWRHTIAQIKKPGKGLASNKTLADMWNSMPKEEVSMSYQDLGQMILDNYFQQKEAMAIYEEMDMEDEAPEIGDVPDVKDLNYSLITKFYQEDHAWYSHMKLKNYSPQKK